MVFDLMLLITWNIIFSLIDLVMVIRILIKKWTVDESRKELAKNYKDPS